MKRLFNIVMILGCFASTAVFAQSQGGFGSIKANRNAPIAVEADQLTIDETANTANFQGAVEIVQGDMRLQAAAVTVFYGESQSDISKMIASGNVVLDSAPDHAEADKADYDVARGSLILTGNVKVLQDGNSLTAQRIDIDLDTGAAKMTGRVKTILTPNQ